MDIGEQKRVIQIEPEPLTVPVPVEEPTPPTAVPAPAVVPEREPVSVPAGV